MTGGVHLLCFHQICSGVVAAAGALMRLTFPPTSAADMSAGKLLADLPAAASRATSAGSMPSPPVTCSSPAPHMPYEQKPLVLLSMLLLLLLPRLALLLL